VRGDVSDRHALPDWCFLTFPVPTTPLLPPFPFLPPARGSRVFFPPDALCACFTRPILFGHQSFSFLPVSNPRSHRQVMYPTRWKVLFRLLDKPPFPFPFRPFSHFNVCLPPGAGHRFSGWFCLTHFFIRLPSFLLHPLLLFFALGFVRWRTEFLNFCWKSATCIPGWFHEPSLQSIPGQWSTHSHPF